MREITKGKIIVALLFLVVMTAAFTSAPCNKEQFFKGFTSNKYRKVTPQGVSVRSANKISDQTLSDIDAGLQDLFNIVRRKPYDYQNFVAHGNYEVALFPRNTKRCENPAFTIQRFDQPRYPDGYDQHPVFDKDPKIGSVILCIAGIVTEFDPQGTFVIVDDAATTRTVTRYEGEHIVLYHNDRRRWGDTIGLHSHPLLGNQESIAENNNDREVINYEGKIVVLTK